MSPKVLVVRSAGTNCDKESLFAFEQAGAKGDLRHVNFLKRYDIISDYQILCIPGGFSYGDNLGAGKILSLEFKLWFKDKLQKFMEKGGLIIGICNGFQVMVKTGILPDCDFMQTVTLTDNDSGRFESRWIYLKTSGTSIWTKGLPQVIALPIAHGEGKFYAEKSAIEKIEKQGQVAVRYCDNAGSSGAYPVNPNASINDIAGITDKSGKIFGLMPHPERFVFAQQWPYWPKKKMEPFGLKIFQNAVNYWK